MAFSSSAAAGTPERALEENFAKEIWDGILTGPGASEKGPRMSLTRWFGWFDCHQYWKRHHTQRVMFLVFLGIRLGYISGSMSSMQSRVKSLGADPSVGQD